VQWSAALMAYDGVGREIVARFKYANARAALAWLAAEMAVLAGAVRTDVVSWVPTTPGRRRARGFDHGRLLAVAVARRLGVPCRPLLVRLPGPAQTGRTRAERLAGPRLVVLGRVAVPARVLLVDDVVTTGATLSSAARALHAAGAEEVAAVAAARRALTGGG
jgi:predicted amidophosphoribosyltransferase